MSQSLHVPSPGTQHGPSKSMKFMLFLTASFNSLGVFFYCFDFGHAPKELELAAQLGAENGTPCSSAKGRKMLCPEEQRAGCKRAGCYKGKYNPSFNPVSSLPETSHIGSDFQKEPISCLDTCWIFRIAQPPPST